MRRLARVGAALLALALLLAPARVLAHAELVTADPGAGSEIERLPDELRLIFSEPLDAAGTAVVLLDGAGRTLAEPAGRIDPSDPRTYLIARADLPESAGKPGSYTLRWKSRSSTDGHASAGEIPYGIVDPATGEVPGLIGGGGHAGHGGLHIGHSSGQILVEVWGRTVGAVGLGIAFALALVAPLIGAPLRRRRFGGLASPASLTLIAAGALANAGGVDALLALLVVAPTPLLVGRVVIELGGALAIALLARRGERLALRAGALAAGLALLLRAASSHGAALGPAEALGYLVHLVAVGAWIVALGSIAWPAWRRRMRVVGALLPRAGAVALVAGGLAGLTGLFGAVAELGEPRALLETDYGRVLLVKLLLVGGAMALGALNLARGARPSGPVGLRGRSLAELVLLGAAAIAAANLGASSPPGPATPVRLVAIADALDLTGGRPPEIVALRAGLSVGLAPGLPGPNRLIINGLAATPKWGTAVVELDRLDAAGSRRIRASREPGADIASADLGVLPAGSSWSISVAPGASDGRELTRLVYRIEFDEAGLAGGADRSLELARLLLRVATLLVGLALFRLGRRLAIARLDRPLLTAGALVAGGALALVGAVALITG
jgi:methionine-rich copper-binding protein CopC